MTAREPRKARVGTRTPRQPTLAAVAPRVGRPSLLNPTTHEDFVRLVRAGHFFSHVAPAMGVSYPTFKRWMALGDEGHDHQTYGCTRVDHTRFREFRASVVRARAQAILVLVGRLQQAAQAGSVTAMLALLRSLAPEEWDPRWAKINQGYQCGSGPPLITKLYESDGDSEEVGGNYGQPRGRPSS